MRTLISSVAFLASTVCTTAASAQMSSTGVHSFDGVSRVWLSLGAGGGSSSRGDFAGRAAVSVVMHRMLAFTVDDTSVGSIDGSVDAINLMVGVQTPRPDAFLFVSGGLANVSCGSGCANQTGIALEAGYHIGTAHAGVSLTGFAVRGPSGSNLAGVVAALDLGWFRLRHGDDAAKRF